MYYYFTFICSGTTKCRYVHIESINRDRIEEQSEVKASQREWFAAQTRPSQVSSLPDPTFSYTRWLENVETRVGPQENVFVLSQRIPFPGKLRLKGDIAKQDVHIKEMAYEEARRNVIFKVTKVYYDLYWIHEIA